MNLCNYLRGNKPVDHVGNYLASLSFAEIANETLSACETKEERIALFDAIRPHVQMNDHTNKISVIHPEYVSVRASA